MNFDEVVALKTKMVDEMRQDRASAVKVAARFAFKYQPKEKKQSKIERLVKLIREKTGLSGGKAEGIAKALARGSRDIEDLARQKGLPVEDGVIKGPKGFISVDKVKAEL